MDESNEIFYMVQGIDSLKVHSHSHLDDSAMIELEPAHKNTEFQNFKIKSASAQFYRNNKWLCES